jgi:molybdopterin molybdotransferase
MLNVISLEKAREMLNEKCFMQRLHTETVPLGQTLGRVLAEDVAAKEDVPGFTRSTVDGYAVIAAETFGASAATPALLRMTAAVQMGRKPDFRICAGECAATPTGGELPSGADAMVMIEDVERFDGGFIAVERPAAPGNHIIFAGDDAKKGSVVLSAGKKLAPPDIGALAALGQTVVTVAKKPRVRVLSTGDEIVDPSETPKNGEVRDVNGALLTAAAGDAGAEAAFCGRVPDDKTQLAERMHSCAQECEMLLLSGGSSVGVKDAAANCTAQLGEMLFHGLAVKPGKPTFAGMIGATLVIGLPGHPAAAWFIFHLLVRPAVEAMMRQTQAERTFSARLASAVPSNAGREEYIAVRLTEGKAEPLMSKSGLISVLARADGYIGIPRDTEGLSKDAPADVHLF